MRGISVFFYCAKQGLQSMRKNKMFTIASVSTMAACLFIFGIFYFIVSNFQYMIDEVETSVGLTVFFDEGSSQEQIDAIGIAIEGRKEVDHMEFISAEEAWERFAKENFENNEELLASFGQDNPLADSASFEVYLKDISTQETVATYIEGIEGVRLVKRSADTAKGLENANALVGYISIAIIGILLLVSIFLINSTISTGITVRRAEIAIMRLMGASDFFIRSPFIVEGVVIGIIGAVIPVVVLSFTYGSIIGYINKKFNLISSWLTFLEPGEVFKVLVPVCLLIGIGIGFLGSYITVHKHLDV